MTRIKKATDDFPRVQQSHVPRDVSANALATSTRISRKQRRNLHQSRELIVQLSRIEPKPEQDRYCAKLKQLSMVQLSCRLKRALQQSKIATRIFATLHESSPQRQRMQLEVALQLYRASWIENEIVLRTKPKTIPAELPVFPDILPEVIAALEAMSPEEREALGKFNDH